MSYYKPIKMRSGDWGFHTPVGKVDQCTSRESAQALAARHEARDRKDALDTREGDCLMTDALRNYFANEHTYHPLEPLK